jgi:hypothetical protein
MSYLFPIVSDKGKDLPQLGKEQELNQKSTTTQ